MKKKLRIKFKEINEDVVNKILTSSGNIDAMSKLILDHIDTMKTEEDKFEFIMKQHFYNKKSKLFEELYNSHLAELIADYKIEKADSDIELYDYLQMRFKNKEYVCQKFYMEFFIGSFSQCPIEYIDLTNTNQSIEDLLCMTLKNITGSSYKALTDKVKYEVIKSPIVLEHLLDAAKENKKYQKRIAFEYELNYIEPENFEEVDKIIKEKIDGYKINYANPRVCTPKTNKTSLLTNLSVVSDYLLNCSKKDILTPAVNYIRVNRNCDNLIPAVIFHLLKTSGLRVPKTPEAIDVIIKTNGGKYVTDVIETNLYEKEYEYENDKKRR